MEPIAQNEAYHRFADTGTWLGVPNFANVVSNLPFAIVGVLAFVRWRRLTMQGPSRLSWAVFFVGVILVAFGSAYYHLAPDNQTLVWDRLPMTLAFIGLTVALLAEQVSPRTRHLLGPGLALGVGSVVVWVTTGDLRLYYGVQLMPMVVALATLVLFGARFTHTHHLGLAVLAYAAAKGVEAADVVIHETSAGLLGGHPLKHLFAALATWFVLTMLWRRRERTASPQ